jgi:hypothetical protein
VQVYWPVVCLRRTGVFLLAWCWDGAESRPGRFDTDPCGTSQDGDIGRTRQLSFPPRVLSRVRCPPGLTMRSALASLGSALLLFACAVRAANDFTLTSLYYEPNEVCTPVEIQIQFVPAFTVSGSDLVKVSLPRFTSGDCKQTKGANIDYGSFYHSLTTFVDMRWDEGDWDYSSMPFANSSITMRVKEGMQLMAGTTYTFVIMKASGIKIYCGLEENWEKLMLWTNASGSTSRNAPVSVAISEQIGDACENLKLCSEHGTCDHCKQVCECDEGFGAVNDSVTKGGYPIAINCAMRTCPLGPAYADVPYGMYAAHQDTECSNNGLCDRAEGFCECFDGWEGDACQRRPCPNDCSGHGRCLTLEELANEKEVGVRAGGGRRRRRGVPAHFLCAVT